MLYQSGTVTEICGTSVRVEFDPAMACGGCSGGYGCGLGPLLAMFRTKGRNFLFFQVEKGARVSVGDRVRVALPARQLVKFASLAYLMPLLGLMVGAWVATILVPHGGDISAVAGAVLGALTGWGGLVASDNSARVTLLL